MADSEQAERTSDKSQPRGWGLWLLLLAVGFAAGMILSRLSAIMPSGTPITVVPPASTPAAGAAATGALVRVYVSGAVREPAVYILPPHSLVADALAAAGGPTDDADLERINLAQEVRDQGHVHVPRQGEVNLPLSSSAGGGSAGALNINTATAAELEDLPRIGPVTAQKIVDYREANGPFARAEDIQNVPGIGPATFEAIREMICVE